MKEFAWLWLAPQQTEQTIAAGIECSQEHSAQNCLRIEERSCKWRRTDVSTGSLLIIITNITVKQITQSSTGSHSDICQ